MVAGSSDGADGSNGVDGTSAGRTAVGNMTADGATLYTDGIYDTGNITLSVSQQSIVAGNVTVGAIAAGGQLERGTLNVQLTGSNSSLSLQAPSYIGPRSSLNVSQSVPSAGFLNDNTETLVGGGSDFATNVAGKGTFNLQAYLSDPAHISPAIVTFQGSVTGQNVHVGAGCQLNLGQPLAFRNGAIGEDPGSQVVLRDTHSTSFSYGNGVLSVVNAGAQVADLSIVPTNGASGFVVTQIGPDTVISAVALSVQQLANAAVPTAVLQE